MSNTRKFLLSYDEEYDSDIHKVISETPRKRISERLRNLIRLGLTVESQGIQQVVQQKIVPATHPAPQTADPEQSSSESHSLSSLQSTNHVESTRERRKRPVRITPPPQS